MECKLIYATPNPLALIYYTYHHEKHGLAYPEDTDPQLWPMTTEQRMEAIKLVEENWGPFLEIPQFMWSMRIPRSFHAQIRTHRHMTFFSESHQVVAPTEFARKHQYWDLPLECTEDQNRAYEAAMFEIEALYRDLLARGVLLSWSRNILPMGIELGLTVNMNLRTMLETVRMRNCNVFQTVYWQPLISMMRQEVHDKVEPQLAQFFDLRPCSASGICLSDIEQDLRFYGDDPHNACPIWAKRKGFSACKFKDQK